MSLSASNTIKQTTTEGPLVLVVDDEQSVRESICDVLTDEQYTVECAIDGPDAISKVKTLKPDVVFLDIWMPGMDGIETLRKIKEFSPKTEVIMISGHASIANALEAAKSGAFDFIEKPLDIDSILFSAKRALERRQIADEVADGLASDSETVGAFPLLSHRGVLSTGISGNNVGQRTLKESVILYGKGLHSGQKSGLVLEPLPPDSGIHFAPIGDSKPVPAYIDFVESTAFATRLSGDGHSVATIEHLMSALHAAKISNLLIKCNVEVPIFDGSSTEFCKTIEAVGIEEQGGDFFEIAIDKKYSFSPKANPSGDSVVESVTLEPADAFIISYELRYPEPIGSQTYEFTLNCFQDFVDQIAPARTFGFLKDVERLQRAGLAAGGSLDNFILIGAEGVVNTEFRFEEELARHKILDVIGDLYLLGRPIRGKVHAVMTGHSDNVGLLKELSSSVLGH